MSHLYRASYRFGNFCQILSTSFSSHDCFIVVRSVCHFTESDGNAFSDTHTVFATQYIVSSAFSFDSMKLVHFSLVVNFFFSISHDSSDSIFLCSDIAALSVSDNAALPNESATIQSVIGLDWSSHFFQFSIVFVVENCSSSPGFFILAKRDTMSV